MQTELLSMYDIQPEAYALYKFFVNTGMLKSLEFIEIWGRTNVNVLHFHKLTNKSL